MSIMMYMLRHMKQSPFSWRSSLSDTSLRLSSSNEKPVSARMQQFREKLQEDAPNVNRPDNVIVHIHEEKEPLKPWPENTNPHTGEIGGPKGPEPTRFGDWERKGRVTDF